VLAELPLAGAFFPVREAHPCTLVTPDESPEALYVSLRALVAGHAYRPPAALAGVFISGAPPLPRGRSLPHPTPAELQCG